MLKFSGHSIVVVRKAGGLVVTVRFRLSRQKAENLVQGQGVLPVPHQSTAFGAGIARVFTMSYDMAIPGIPTGYFIKYAYGTIKLCKHETSGYALCAGDGHS